jgi:hypothetical protein
VADEAADVIQQYPPYVTTPEDRERWDNAKGIAEALFGDQGEGAVWSATRAIYSDPDLEN